MVSSPVRTCCVCRNREGQGKLLRLALVNGELRVDSARAYPGRGSYVHPRTECFEGLKRKGLLTRAFRSERQIGASAVVIFVEGLIEQYGGTSGTSKAPNKPYRRML